MTYKRRHVKNIYQYSYMQFETHTSVYIYIYIYVILNFFTPVKMWCLCLLSFEFQRCLGLGGWSVGAERKNFSSSAYFVLLSPCLKTLKTNGNTFLCGWVLGALMGHLFLLSLSLSLCLCACCTQCALFHVFFLNHFVLVRLW